jgi:SAM-dependent methyltransferase
MTLRSWIGRSRVIRSSRDNIRAGRARIAYRLLAMVSFERLPPSLAIELAYQVMLRRRPDPVGFQDGFAALTNGQLSRQDIVERIRGSEEFTAHTPFSGSMLQHSIHAGRGQFIRGLPRARRIVDLGGTHLHNDMGAMVALGYPYPFDELVIIDLPSRDRHAIYRSGPVSRQVQTPLGPVRYRYHSMTDLSGFDDGSVDLVYSGQSIEHVTPEDGSVVLREVFRILRPGAWFAIDTPNTRVTRLQQEAFIDPDHKVEYTCSQLAGLLSAAGFEVVESKGLNYAGRSLANGRFDVDEVAANSGLYAAAEDCYILCVLAQKPALAAGSRD